MIRGLYTAATGMQSQQSRMDTVTNNLANAQTIGYKQDTLLTRSFEEQLISRLGDSGQPGGQTIGSIAGGVHIDEVATLFGQGAHKATGIQTDLALTGDGFFTIATPAGERYTRAGSFTVSADGFLTTQDGQAVLGENGPIQVGSEPFSVSANGLVVHQDGVDALRITAFDDNSALQKTGSGLWQNTGAGTIAGTEVTVSQGYLEQSNVDLTEQVVDMMSITRNYEINQRVLKTMDERLGQAVNEIGKL